MLPSKRKFLLASVCASAVLYLTLPAAIAQDSSYSNEIGQQNYADPPPLPKAFLEKDDNTHLLNNSEQPIHPDNEIPLKTDSSPSRLETFYSERAKEPLTQFGYDTLDTSNSNEISGTPLGAVQEDFILNIGDTLQITFSGQRSETLDAQIDSQGLLLIRDFKPIAAVGLSIGQLRARLENAAQNLHNTQIFVSLSSVKQIGILLIGHVEKPGRYNLTTFNSIPEALSAAGGIKKTGSLRDIKLIRSGQSESIDLYELLIRGAPAIDIKLRDGDRIIVPPIGQTIAIAGEVKQAGIYELPPQYGSRGQSYTLHEALSYAGGILARGENRYIKLGLNNDGREITENLSLQSQTTFKDGDLLLVNRARDKRENMIEVIGNSRNTGLHDVQNYATLQQLIDSEQFLEDDTYPLIGIIKRSDKQNLSSNYIIFSVQSVLNKKENHNLLSEDKVYIFSSYDISVLFNKINNDTNKILNKENLADLSAEIISILKENTISVNGGVRLEGLYPAAANTPLETLLSVAGGLTRSADKHHVEVTSTAAPDQSSTRKNYNLTQSSAAHIFLNPGDSVRVNIKSEEIEEKSVLLSGEVRSPGRYDLLPNDKLSDLIARAGGLSDQAYPIGAIFSRESERRAEEARFRAAAKDLEHSLAAAMRKDDKAPDITQIEMVRGLARELSTVQALGRITVEADPSTLQARPELDILLEEGDRLYIPKRPLTVRVSGEVLSPAGLQFRKDKNPDDYIREAGGFTYHADKKRSFVLFPDGSAQPLRDGLWSNNPVLIPPGSTIIVPRDPKPFDFIQSARDFTQILSNLAVTSIFIDDLRD